MKKDKVKQEWDEHRASIVKECAIWIMRVAVMVIFTMCASCVQI